MKTFRLFYLYVFLFDAVVSIIATLNSRFELYSGFISLAVGAMSLGVFIMAKVDIIRPSLIFKRVAGFYLAMITFAILTGIALVSKLGPEMEIEGSEIAFLSEQFAWFLPVHWIWMIAWVALGIWSIKEFQRYESSEKPDEIEI